MWRGPRHFTTCCPDLIPPIDRTYTIRFFHENTLMPRGDEHAFKEVYPALVEIAARARGPLDSQRPVSDEHESDEKIIDNAIIGYVGKLKVVPDDESDY